VHVVSQKMALLHRTLFLAGQLPQHLAQVLAEAAVQYLPTPLNAASPQAAHRRTADHDGRRDHRRVGRLQDLRPRRIHDRSPGGRRRRSGRRPHAPSMGWPASIAEPSCSRRPGRTRAEEKNSAPYAALFVVLGLALATALPFLRSRKRPARSFEPPPGPARLRRNASIKSITLPSSFSTGGAVVTF
jgi:hypothetical protein